MVTSQIVEPGDHAVSTKRARPARRFIEESLQVACSSLGLRLADYGTRTRCRGIRRVAPVPCLAAFRFRRLVEAHRGLAMSLAQRREVVILNGPRTAFNRPHLPVRSALAATPRRPRSSIEPMI